MRGLAFAIATLFVASGCDYFAYEPTTGRSSGCGGVYFTCTNDSATDSRTGLTWLRERRVASDFADAEAQCADLRTDAKLDWRLPTIAELRQVEDPYFAEEGYHLDPGVFPVNGSLPYFSSTTIDDQQVKGWSFSEGQAIPGSEPNPSTPGCTATTGPSGEVKLYRACSAFLRCVRGGSTDGGS
jgi:hypothetical protein